MSKRPRIKQADGSLLDLPLDAETIKGKTLEEIALKTDIPTKTSQLTNDNNYATTSQLFSKNYNDLTNKPSIPTSTSQLTNDSGFKTTDNNTTYTLSGSNATIILTPSSGNTQSITVNNVAKATAADSATKATQDGSGNVIVNTYAKKSEIPTKTSELTNDSNFLTEHQDISGKADKTELDNYIPYITGTADNAKNIHWDTRLNSFQFDIESTKPSIKFIGDRVGSATITPNKIELNGNSESGTASILLDGKSVALQENIPTKLSQLEQDVELGVSEEDVINIISQYISSNFENGDEGSY